MRTRARRTVLGLVTVLAFLLGLGATLMVFAQDRILDADSFSTTAAATLEDPAINAYLSEAIVDELIDQVPDLALGGPLLSDVVGSVLESSVAVGIVESSAREAHQVVFDGGDDTLLLELSDLVVSINQALAAVDPDLADVLPDDLESLAVELSSGELAAGTVRLADRLRFLTFVLVAVAGLALVAMVLLESSAYRALARLGLTLGCIGLALVVLQSVGAEVIASLGRTDPERDALAATWHLVLGDLTSWGWVLTAVGVILAGSGWAVVNRGRAVDRLRSLGSRLVAEPETLLGTAGRACVALFVALWAMFDPQSLVTALIRFLGFGLAIAVVAQLTIRTGLAQRLARMQPDAEAIDSPRALARRAALPVIALVGLGVIGGALLVNDDPASALVDPEACNGHVELCDRRLDEITMATSHNAMSSTATRFYLPNHLTAMRAQLDQGVRGFMIDTLYGRAAPDGTVRSSLDPVDVDTLDEGARAAAEAVRARQTEGLGDEQVFLCHAFCELGAIDAVDALRGVRVWLDEHPRDVLVFIVQDATDPEDTAAVFVDAGFEDLLHTQELDMPFPTLGEMIDSGRRVFVMVEEDGAGVDWLHAAFEFSQETPFSFGSADEFSCAPNRGTGDAPLFVVNHFITLARAGNRTINDSDVLLDRAEQCREERGRQPNLLAVDFVSEGDVIAVVDELNDVG